MNYLSIKYALLMVSIACLLLSGSIVMIEGLQGFGTPLLLISMLGILFISVFHKIKFDFTSSITVIYTLFIFCILISSLVNSDLGMFLSFIRYVLLFYTLVVLLPNLTSSKTFKITIIAFLISQLPLILFSLIEDNPFQQISGSYSGIFYNPNSFGGVAASIFVLIYALLLDIKKRSIYRFILLPSLIVFFLLTIFSGSRTSFLSILFILISSVVLIFLKNNSVIKISLKNLKQIFWGISLTSLLYYVFVQSKYYLVFNEIVITKFVTKYNSGDVLANRGDIFSKTIQDAKMFGNGSEYFTNNFGLGAHNTFISVLGQYGVLAAIAFIIFWIVAIYISLKYYYENNRLLPLLMIICFILLSMAEIMLMKVSMLFGLIAIGVISKNISERKVIH